MSAVAVSIQENAVPYKAPDLWRNETAGQLRKDLLRFALVHVHNREVAEDMVQETLMSALAASGRFESRASLKTWLIAILKNKIIDLTRSSWYKHRLTAQAGLGEGEPMDAIFDLNGSWQCEYLPSDWGDPEKALENAYFWQVFEKSLSQMPQMTARVFSMREIMGLEVNEICRELDITPSHCWVILHRARIRLRADLEEQWFAGLRTTAKSWK